MQIINHEPMEKIMANIPQAFLEAEAEHKNVVMHQTWGHLAAEPRVKHYGTMLFCRGEYRDIIPIRTKFDTVGDSPWFYAAMQEYIFERAQEDGAVYSWDGYYMMQKNGKGVFVGKSRKLKI